MMKTIHRLLSLIACLVLLYIGVTGTLIQVLDLSVLLRHAPETNETMQSINEGRFGNPPYAIVTRADFGPATLPAGLDYGKAFTTVVQAAHQQKPDAKPDFVELRNVGGATVGQLQFGKEVLAFDAATGAPVKAVSLTSAKPPKSLRQTIKQWHRFWGPDYFSHRDKPGVYFEFGFGLVLWAMIISGLVMYWNLWSARAKMDRKQLFWSAGGIWRTLHRVVSLASAVLLIAVAASGTWIGFESSYHTFQGRPQRVKPALLSDSDVVKMSAQTLAVMRRTEPQTPIKVLRVREYAGYRQGVVVTGGATTEQRVFDLATGRSLSLKEPRYPSSGFPLGIQTHEDVKHFHGGFMFGLPARFLDLLAGLSLIFLSVSGATMYLQLWLKRRKNGRGAFVWL